MVPPRCTPSECWTNDGQDVGECMIRGGWASDYTCYSGGYYRDLETEARNKALGLWECDNGPPTKRWGRHGAGTNCETPGLRAARPRRPSEAGASAAACARAGTLASVLAPNDG